MRTLVARLGPPSNPGIASHDAPDRIGRNRRRSPSRSGRSVLPSTLDVPPFRRRKRPGPNAGQAQEGAPAGTAQNGQQQLQLIASSWTRYCIKNPTEQSSEVKTKEVCFTASDGHLKSGQKLVIALLLEPKGSDAKLLRVTLPLGVALVPGARIVIDSRPP